MPDLNGNSARLACEADPNVVATRARLDEDSLSRKDVAVLKSLPVAVEVAPYPGTRASLLRTSNGLFLPRLSFLGTPFPGGHKPAPSFADRNATESVVSWAEPQVRRLTFRNRPPPDSNIAVVAFAHEARDVNIRAREIRSGVEKIEQLPARHDV
jgi:hypothetical protein